ncbi:uncharacterized protein UHO2_02201 [Ustilago hordei]|uniref:Reverse transcriptase Ty1/copia-type domain-containing protein n=1 Tax=Ustilago hordei TaxID=120017 RepID=I2G6T1_USTHO|nr:uncharacterized protein UHO2_02201 [Ustilago hordei]CCF54874.1 uncharacterized protein UHOR_01357 [Ustilago hordei]SYW85967.1 uncharacterized protein UHO2_02201 [Ustilago hordei]
MVEENDPQAGASTIDATGEYNVNYILLDTIKEYLTFNQVWKRIKNGLGSKATRNSCQLTLITQLGDVKMFNSDAQKLIQEIRTIQVESSILGKPFAEDTLFSTLQKCMIWHPMYKDTIATVHHLNFDALAIALSMCQLAIESVPAQKWDPWQANARIAGSTKKGNSAKEADANDTRATWSKNCKICCYEIWYSLTPGWKRPQNQKDTAHWILDSGASFHMANDYSIIINPKTCQKCVFTAGSEILEATAVGDVNISTEHGDIFLQNILTFIQQLWHEHLGHPGQDKARVIVKKLADQMTMEMDPDTALTCEQCIQSKSTIAQMGQGSGERATAPLDLVHIDLIIDLLHATEHTCMLVLVDDHSKQRNRVASDCGVQQQTERPGYSLERKGWLFYSPDYRPNIFWSNLAKFLEPKHWTDWTEWRPMNVSPPLTLTDEEDPNDLWYSEENLFDKSNQESLDEYTNMDPDQEADNQTSHKAWTNNNTFGLMATNLPAGVNTIDTRWVLKIKTDANLVPMKFKARLVAQRFTQKAGVDYTEIFAPVAPIQLIRGVLVLAVVQNWEVDTIDVKQAYLNSSLHHDVYLQPLVGTTVPPGKVLKLMKGLYGLKQSGGMADDITIITAYIDDMLIVSPSQNEVDCTKGEIMRKWGTQDNGSIKEFLGIKITRDRKQGSISLDLMAYIQVMSKKYQELVGQLLGNFGMTHVDTDRQGMEGGNPCAQVSKPNKKSGDHTDEAVMMYTDTNWASDATNGGRSMSGVITYIYRCLCFEQIVKDASKSAKIQPNTGNSSTLTCGITL